MRNATNGDGSLKKIVVRLSQAERGNGKIQSRRKVIRQTVRSRMCAGLKPPNAFIGYDEDFLSLYFPGRI